MLVSEKPPPHHRTASLAQLGARLEQGRDDCGVVVVQAVDEGVR